MPFCIQNDLEVKIWIFAKLDYGQEFNSKKRKNSTYRVRFFSEGGLGVFNTAAILFWRFSAKKLIFCQFCWCMVEKNFSKSIFFDFFKVL